MKELRLIGQSITQVAQVLNMTLILNIIILQPTSFVFCNNQYENEYYQILLNNTIVLNLNFDVDMVHVVEGSLFRHKLVIFPLGFVTCCVHIAKTHLYLMWN